MNTYQIDRQWFVSCLQNQSLIQKIKNIKLIICDVDGSLTNAGIYVTAEGEGGRTFSIQDGYIVKPLIKAGISVSLMSGKENASTFQRAQMIGVPQDLCMVGALDKPPATRLLHERLGVSAEQTIIFGDDFLDMRVKKEQLVSLFVAPSDAPFYVQAYADMVIPRGGGVAAFRLFADLVLYVQEKHFAQEFIQMAVAS